MPPINPGSTIGVLGSGQLGRMFALEARRMGYRVHTFSPDSDTPTGQVADVEIVAAYDDIDAVERFAKRVDVVTFEFENVPSVTAAAAERHAPVRPAGSVLHTTQNRLREKTFLASAGLPVTPFQPVASLDALHAGIKVFNGRGVLKTAGWGYDGKGQVKISAPADVAKLQIADWKLQISDSRLADPTSSLAGQAPCILEKLIEFRVEVSVVAARGLDGSFVHWGVFENAHRNHVLDLTIAPAGVSEKIHRDAIDIARQVLEKLQVVGVLCVEFFLTQGDELMINELAPRPHNSGHVTIDAHVTSQFEQQLRAICGLPLGSTEQLRPAAMANLLGDVWAGGEPNWSACTAMPGVKLHLYGKSEARAGRKMGHLTALAATGREAAERVLAARDALLAR